MLVHKYEYERPEIKWGGRNHDLMNDWSQICMAPVARWKTWSASKLASQHNALPQRRKVHGGRAPIWIEFFVSDRC